MRTPWIFSAVLLATTACSPACSPPPADPAVGRAAGPASAEKKSEAAKVVGDPAPAAEHELKAAPGVDLSKLSDAQKDSFFQVINAEPSACGKPHSLAKSLNEDSSCRDSRLVAQFVADQIQLGAPIADAREACDIVTKSLQPRTIETEGRPVYGVASAPVTVVVFADFECPHCAAEAPKLRAAIQAFRGKAKLVYRHFPLSGHERAKVAAMATEAAFAQGKFWEFHDKVFSNQSALEDADLIRYATEIGLDVAKFKADFAAKKGAEQVEKDRAAGEALEIQGTPAVFINGRYYNPALFGGTFEGWIDDALRR
jgi:protein-disulfide isomerase